MNFFTPDYSYRNLMNKRNDRSFSKNSSNEKIVLMHGSDDNLN